MSSSDEITYETVSASTLLDIDVLREEVETQLDKYEQAFKNLSKRDMTPQERDQYKVKLLRSKLSDFRAEEGTTGEEYVGFFFGVGQARDQNDFQRNLAVRLASDRPSEAKYALRRPPEWIRNENTGKSEIVVHKMMEDGTTKNGLAIKYKSERGYLALENGKFVPLLDPKTGKAQPIRWVVKEDGRDDLVVWDTRQYFEQKEDNKKIYRINDNFQKELLPRFRSVLWFIGRKVESTDETLHVYCMDSRDYGNRAEMELPPTNTVTKVHFSISDAKADKWGYFHGKLGTKQFPTPTGRARYILEDDEDVIKSVLGDDNTEEILMNKLSNRVVKFGIGSFSIGNTRFAGLKKDDYKSKKTAKLMISKVWIREFKESDDPAKSHQLSVETLGTSVQDSKFTCWLTRAYELNKALQNATAQLVYEPSKRWNRYANAEEWQMNGLNLIVSASEQLLSAPAITLGDLDSWIKTGGKSNEAEVDPTTELSVDDLDDSLEVSTEETPDLETSTEESTEVEVSRSEEPEVDTTEVEDGEEEFVNQEIVLNFSSDGLEKVFDGSFEQDGYAYMTQAMKGLMDDEKPMSFNNIKKRMKKLGAMQEMETSVQENLNALVLNKSLHEYKIGYYKLVKEEVVGEGAEAKVVKKKTTKKAKKVDPKPEPEEDDEFNEWDE